MPTMQQQPQVKPPSAPMVTLDDHGEASPVGWQFALGQHVRRTGDPAQRWEIWYRSCREEVDRTFIDYGLRLVNPEAAYHPCRMSDGTDLTPVEEP